MLFRNIVLWCSLHWFKIVLVLFVLTRLFIWIYRPVTFSEVTYSYMPYAHLWASGVKPYLEQWYEYPPATIPLFYIPHWVDMATRYSWLHINYGHAYRLLIFLIDAAMFAAIIHYFRKTKVDGQTALVSAAYYLLVSAKAHHFIYDTIDWAFAGTFLLAAVGTTLFSGIGGQSFGWLMYWLGVALKLVNGPLGAVYLWLEKKHWKQAIVISGLAAAVVWGLPVLLYRSSLQVMLVFHEQRGLQVDSAGGVLSRLINQFTNSETVIEIYKNYEQFGPVTTSILQVVEILLPVSIVAFLGFAWWLSRSVKTTEVHSWKLHFTLGYVLLFMIFSKVLSTPFLLWHIPLVAVYPFASQKQRYWWFAASAVIIVTCMSPLPFITWKFINLPLWIHTVKILIFMLLAYHWVKMSVDKKAAELQ